MAQKKHRQTELGTIGSGNVFKAGQRARRHHTSTLRTNLLSMSGVIDPADMAQRRSPQVRYEGMNRPSPFGGPTAEFDPHVWSGRALQEDFVELAAAVLHQCIRPLIGACGAPGHHGYQRACVLISGQASIGPFGSPVFARARKTEPPSRLILSQTSAGNC
ncbi:hypothetical protein SAMN05443247_05052 [Bradyrhizobium erythrophlei]|jgi:hypothetical protein|nr:hypothetical protein SAMN05443247_05052 [Bradyrhizobium erythrophlei]